MLPQTQNTLDNTAWNNGVMFDYMWKEFVAATFEVVP